jgi:hypothetical protein
MPIYDDMLAYFPELVEEYEIFRMKPKAGGTGYGPRTDKVLVDGIVQWIPGGKLGINGETRDPNTVATFWVSIEDDGSIKQGSYIDLGEKGIFILTKDNSYGATGGYVRFVVGIVPGVTDKQVTNTKVKPTDDYS